MVMKLILLKLKGVSPREIQPVHTYLSVLEILLLRIMHDDNLTKVKLTHSTHHKEDGGSIQIPVLQCFADDMTCVIEETEKNLLMMKTIFESFAGLSGLEINEGKTKVIRIGAKLDDNTPLTNKVKFIYANTFKLLGVNIDNKLKNLTDNFEARKKKIRTKIAIWRKLNLSEVGNLIISKTFLVSQLGYLLSMMSCPDKLLH